MQRKHKSTKKYSSKRWREFRITYLRANPLCKNFDECKNFATEIDHIKRVVRESDEHFYDLDNLQGLCKSCHSRKTAKQDGAFGNKKKND